MNVSYFIAKRYFLSKRKKNFINIISILSMIGVAFGTAALIIVLSVFNGLEDLIRSMNTSFDPELKVEPVKGKSFQVNDELISKIKAVPGVEIVTEVIEDYAYIRYRESDMVVTIKGMSNNFIDQHRLDDHLDEGKLRLRENATDYAILGRGVRNNLSVDLDEDFDYLQIYYIKNIKLTSIADPSQAYSRKSIKPTAVFSIEKNYDENYIFLPLDFTRDLLDYGNKRTALEVKTTAASDISDIQERVVEALGDSFVVLTNEEQHKDLYRLLKIEKLFMFMALALLIVIASINIFFSLMMLALDKKKDISILTAIGASQHFIRRIFLTEGAMIALIGAVVGLVMGGTLCWLQDSVGLVSMGMEDSVAVVHYYPVKMKLLDFLSTSCVVLVVTLVMSIYPASRAARFYAPELL